VLPDRDPEREEMDEHIAAGGATTGAGLLTRPEPQG